MPVPSSLPVARDRGTMSEDHSILHAPAPPFLLRHSPGAWEVATEGMSEPTWLPILSPHILIPGAGGIRVVRRNAQADSAYKTAVRDNEDRGWTYLDHNEVIPSKYMPKGVNAGTYCRAYDCRDSAGNKGIFHCEPWYIPVTTPAGRPQKFTFDRASYNRWRKHLVTSGVIQAPTEWAIAPQVTRMHQRVAVAEVQPIPDAVRLARVDEAKAAAKLYADAKVPS